MRCRSFRDRRIDGSGLVSRRIASGYTPVSYSPDGKMLIAYHENAEFDQSPDDPAVLDSTDGASIDSLEGLVSARVEDQQLPDRLWHQRSRDQRD